MELRWVASPAWSRMLAAMAIILACLVPGVRAQQSAVVDSASVGGEFVHPATPGVVKGHVLAGDDGRSLDYTNIVFQIYDERGRLNPAGGTIALTDGYYVYRCSPGTYKITYIYLGYERFIAEKVVVRPAQTTELEVVLKLKPIEFEMLEITAARIADTEFSLRSQQKKAVAVSDAISSEEISRGTDGTAAEALERVTGLTVVGGKFVFVRGLGDRYSQTQVNGATLSSPEPNKRTVPLDVFPASLLENVVVQKTYTPNMEGEFGGGVVNVSTKDFVDRREFNQSFGFGYNANTLNEGRLEYQGGEYDRLGFDDGTRDLPSSIPDDRLRRQSRVNPGYTIDELREIRETFPNVWEPQGRGSEPNFSYSGDYSDSWNVLGKQLGFLGALTLKNSQESLRQMTEREYAGSTDDSGIRRDYETNQSTFSTLGGATAAFSYKLSDDDVIKLNSLYTQSSDDRARISEGMNNNFGAAVRQYTLTYTERGLSSQVLSGHHGFLMGSTVNWVGSYSDAYFGEPDRRRVIYEDAGGDIGYRLSGRTTSPFLRIYGESYEYDRNAQLGWSFPILSAWMPESSIEFGGSYRNRDRNSAYRRFGMDCPSGAGCSAIDYTLDPEVLMDPDNPDTADFYVFEDTRSADSWDASQDVSAAYGMLDLRMGRLRATGGLRFERSDTHVLAKSPWAVDDPGTDISRRFEDGLPAVNLTYALTERQNVRVSYSKTLNRPELREISPFSMYNYDDNIEESGNPNLVQARLHSYDFRWEFYPGFTRLIAFSAFYKDLKNPIEQKMVAVVTGATRAPINGDAGILRGVEFELRASLADIFSIASLRQVTPGLFFERWGLGFNHSRIFSEVHVPTQVNVTKDTPRRTVSLTGQSDETTNVQLFYESERISGSVAYKYFGPRLFAQALGTLPDIYEYPGSTLDAAMSYRLVQNLKLKFSVENITGNVVERLQGDAVWQRWVPGQTFGASLSLSY